MAERSCVGIAECQGDFCIVCFTVFEEVVFEKEDYDFYSTPLWIDKGIEKIRELVTALVEVKIIKEQLKILKRELRVTTQRVNLFEKIKIPQCIENIRVIRIYLGDLQANAVGISKVAKKKIEKSNLEEVLV